MGAFVLLPFTSALEKDKFSEMKKRSYVVSSQPGFIGLPLCPFQVDIQVNGENVGLKMHLGEAGEAYFLLDNSGKVACKIPFSYLTLIF